MQVNFLDEEERSHQVIENEDDYKENLNHFDNDTQLENYARKKLTDEDLETVRTSLQILHEVQDAATILDDMRGELATEIT